jgi:hypothetical protein
MAKHYVRSEELEEWWQGWIVTGCPIAWEETTLRIHQICCGIAKRFNPRNEEEYQEHVHDAFSQTIEKIKTGKLKFIHGKAPVFNLVTTTVFRILYSKMNRQKKHKEHEKKYIYECTQELAPELLGLMEYPSRNRSTSSAPE